LRELERAAALGDDDAGARLLGERLRQGTLSEARVALAAYAGDPRAAMVVGDGAEPELDLATWLQGLWGWGREVPVRAAIAAGRHGIEHLEARVGWSATGCDGKLALRYVCASETPYPLDMVLLDRRELEALEAWVCCPCADHARAAADLNLTSPAGAVVATVVSVALAQSEEWLSKAVVVAVSKSMAGSRGDAVWPAIKDALTAWALGGEDPVRVEPRLPRPSPRWEEWRRRGWEARYGDGTMRVTLAGWTRTAEGDELDALVAELDAKLWEERLWLPPRSLRVAPFTALNAYATTHQIEHS
jgi:hypothetical protein